MAVDQGAAEAELADAALKLGYVTAEDFDRLVDPAKMLGPLPASKP